MQAQGDVDDWGRNDEERELGARARKCTGVSKDGSDK